MTELPRATQILPSGQWQARTARDTVTAGFDDRHRRRKRYTGEKGLSFLLDLPEAVALRDGDGLLLEGGGVVLVRAAPEPLIEVRGRDALHLLRLAWHLGNRHLPAEIDGERILIREDHVILRMLQPVRNTRNIGKRDMVLNDALPRIEIDPETYEVRADGELLICEPAAVLPMAQRYFLF